MADEPVFGVFTPYDGPILEGGGTEYMLISIVPERLEWLGSLSEAEREAEWKRNGVIAELIGQGTLPVTLPCRIGDYIFSNTEPDAEPT